MEKLHGKGKHQNDPKNAFIDRAEKVHWCSIYYNEFEKRYEEEFKGRYLTCCKNGQIGG